MKIHIHFSRNFLDLKTKMGGSRKMNIYFLKLDFCKFAPRTSVKIFKHYKLKPSFSIFKDEKAKDKVGLGDIPHPKV